VRKIWRVNNGLTNIGNWAGLDAREGFVQPPGDSMGAWAAHDVYRRLQVEMGLEM
jgi:hypothetical protein